VFTSLEPRPGPATSDGKPVSNMPATIEEIQGVVAGLSEVVKGLVGAIQAVHTAQTTGSQATPPENPAVPSTGVASFACQLSSYLRSVKIRKFSMIFPIFSIVFTSRQLNFLLLFACRSLSGNVLVSGHVQCCRFVELQNPPTRNAAAWLLN